ncbi:hypothetical protein C1H46_038389 [Malus baccata]|uniref:Uncharacterized protein n=1 Tax=Malus baccata TaxID=106549 RepID=A0A540KPG6_MALBA|nr:hypothetical protein C1H46_038389 [Malus baccata]
MEKRKQFETAKICVAYGFLMSFIGNDNVATALSITVTKLECVSEQVLYEGDIVSGNFVAIDLRHPLEPSPLVQFLRSSLSLISTPELRPPYTTPRAISDLKEAIVKGLGFQAEDLKVSGFDLKDSQMGHSVAYEFDVEMDNKVLPFKVLEDVDRWDYVNLPIFRVEDEN